MNEFAVWREPKAAVEQRDLADLTTVEEVKAAVNTALKRSIEATFYGAECGLFNLCSENADASMAKGHL